MSDANTRHTRVPPPRAAHSVRSASRRVWLAGVGASAAALAAGAALSGLSGAGAVSPAYADAPPPSAGLDAFLALSRKLTGRTNLDPVLAKRVYAALSKMDSQADNLFAQNVATLNSWLQTHGGVPSDTVIAALQPDMPALAKTASAIVRAWYLGLVGDPPRVQVIAYENALMFDPVKDVLTVPSYCRDVPLYWAQKPTNA
ncbi:sugar dehydrogenase complex small subunit [Paraburkholderia solisilvae]|uniref:Fructose dehydrogenase small subunit n=1 Tax=Paraburkholderia solisilvae TaxID=624376 RepID=A0A6J5DWF5_9BURK|nr:sugar dehydrogenase complex small subunit [Paraburkholderia solisilvae]CAB3757342.1 Fructose dehydrogenase small subunit [Paraburkholderia solisilvae]